MTLAARPTMAVTIALLLFVPAPIAAQPEKTLDKCQKTVGKETAKYVGSRQKAFAKCLDKISAERIGAAASDAAAAAKTCASSLRKVGNSEYPDKTLEAKFRAKVAKACDPAVNTRLAHIANDVLGGVGLVSGDQVDASTLGTTCAEFGGDGAVDDIDEWLDCIVAAATCHADQQLGVAYPNVLVWLADVRADVLALDPGDPAKADAVAVIDALDAALDADNDEVFDLTCGGVPGVPCATGRFSPTGDEPCLDCPVGTFQNQTGQTSCTPCGAGLFGNGTGAEFCQACPFGTFQDAPGQASCQPCAPGTYADSIGLSACTPCAPGKFASALGLTSCENCAAESFADSTGSASCELCPVGRFAASTGSASCSPCSAGSFASGTGATSCAPCDVGTATSSSGQANCAACAPGTFADSFGQTSCTACAPGRFTSTSGNSACPQCPAGTFAPLPRMTDCVDCPGAPVGSAACTCTP